MSQPDEITNVSNSADSPRSPSVGWALAGCYVAFPFVIALIATARLTPADCCWGRGVPVAFTMVFGSMLGALVILWPAVAIVRSADGGKLTRGHFWAFIGITVAVFVAAPLFVGNLLEGNL
ncbi:MAG: hypothetical protein GWP18_01020 [Proteobacteria bacterium]|nr:hypothetical protein [Pseudomonadota bacterium]